MLRNLLFAGAAGVALSTAAFAQTPPATPDAAVAAAVPTAAATVDLGVQPLADVPAPNYVVWAWQANAFEIASAKVALRKAVRADVKAYAQSMLTTHEEMQKSLEASLKNETRVFTKPVDGLDPGDAALIAQLEKSPAAGFDTLYLTQQAAAHQKAWAMQKGFANSGQDPALKMLATANVPMIEQHFAQAKSLVPAGQAG